MCDEKLKEQGTVMLMEMVIERYAKKYDIPINEVIDKFTRSKLYDYLFDYDRTLIWHEGPEYVLDIFESME